MMNHLLKDLKRAGRRVPTARGEGGRGVGVKQERGRRKTAARAEGEG
jgi:hypothetical protein